MAEAGVQAVGGWRGLCRSLPPLLLGRVLCSHVSLRPAIDHILTRPSQPHLAIAARLLPATTVLCKLTC